MANITHCPECGYNFAAFGKVHRCIPRVAKPAVNPVPAVAATVSVVGGEESDAARTIGVGPAVSAHGAAGTYKYRDRDKRRAYMRDYMRKRREKTVCVSGVDQFGNPVIEAGIKLANLPSGR